MAANEVVGHTEFEKMSSYKFVRKRAVQLKIKYRIENFGPMMDAAAPGMNYWSEGISSELAPRAVWKLRVYPNGVSGENRGCTSVFLHLTGPMRDSNEKLDATYHLYLIDGSDGSKIDLIGRNTDNFGENGWGASDISHDRVKNALHADGSLLMTADVEFLLPDECGAKAVSESVLQGYENLQQWATNFFELHGNDASSDCTIEIGGISIPAHKYPLMAQSPIFRSMFTNSLAEESKSGVVKVTDFKEAEPMRALVRYCYQGQLDTTTMDGEGEVEVFKLADRYCISGLKAQLEKHFVETRLSKENVVAMAVLAGMHSATELKEACINLIVSDGSAVFEIDDWKELSDGELIAEVFQLASKYRIGELRTQLEKHFVDKRLIVENAVSMAVLASTHSAAKLKEACIKLIAQEWKTVSASAEWKDLEETQPKLTIELAVGAATLLSEK